ncbi:MAG: hypothetical protein AAGD04_00105 [Pseudomonadota bacterium]
MKTMKTCLAATVLAVLPTLSFAMGCNYEHTTQTATMSCADGTTFDAESGKCVTSVSS